ncbi:MAG: ferritin-like domain-containing protein [Candidatus Devosia phytovorans]|uniref:Ferritin-like domain-containing protein n=1 Tax=Candidatus Devosia phytovorans TaxID=3121372 RepID=A0AAJ5VVW2_9HYPH|nr:ferritin-like domain-containing protein [Devosia sp.]WEK05878.1 MAG: ferritin-like domain-containing protein [Devosia sp.]
MNVSSRLSRRNLLKWTGAAGTIAVAGSLLPNFGISAALGAELGDGDIGVLNYAYALEQLEAAFYTQVLDTPFGEMQVNDQRILTQIRDHEIAHRDFLKKALGGNAIPGLEVDFSAVDFSSRRSVLTTADVFENLGVAAYNGAGQLISNPDYLVAAGSIVSIEARHAAAIADLLKPFSAEAAGRGNVDHQGLDGALLPSEVLKAAAPFIATPVTAATLP